MDNPKTEKKILPRVYRHVTSNTKKNTKKNTSNNKNRIFFVNNKSSKNIKFNNVSNKGNKNKVINDLNKSKQDNSFYDVLKYRRSFIVPENNKVKLIPEKRLTLKCSVKKQSKEINITNNNINNINNRYLINNTVVKKNSISKTKNKRKENNQIETNKEKANLITEYKINIKKKKKIENKQLRSTNIPIKKNLIYENLNIDIDIKEKKDENEINNKVLRHNTTVFNCEKNNSLFRKEENNYKNSNNNNEHDLDKFFRQNNNNIINTSINDPFRFSNISKINNNDLYYLNNNINNNYPEHRNSSIFINPKVEENESHELFDFEKKILEEIDYNEQKHKVKDILENNIEPIVSLPCLNCDKLINIDEIDEHSNKCFNIKKKNEINTQNNDNYMNIIENKLKNILEYLTHLQKTEDKNNKALIEEFKTIIDNILSIKEINSFSIEQSTNINTKINSLMEKCLYDDNIFTLLSRTKILLEEKIKLFSDKTKKVSGDNSIEEIISEGETTEFFDLKKMEKILDEKELKTQNLDKLVNEAKNKRLFLMEVQKVKFQKIKENKNEDLISPELIWKEALKKNIEMNNWTQFIFNELNNPNKYIKIIQRKNNSYQKRK